MRMAGEGESAADLVNTLEETELANLLFAYGEERKSRRIAHSIVAAPRHQADCDHHRTGAADRKDHRPQARRRPSGDSQLPGAVNDEFGQLVEGLFASERLLGEGGRLAVVTFHSLEDRIVKRFFDPDKGGPAQSRHLPQVVSEALRWIDVPKGVKASSSEIARNPRSRSAMLRSGHRSSAPARTVSFDGLGVPRFRGAA